MENRVSQQPEEAGSSLFSSEPEIRPTPDLEIQKVQATSRGKGLGLMTRIWRLIRPSKPRREARRHGLGAARVLTDVKDHVDATIANEQYEAFKARLPDIILYLDVLGRTRDNAAMTHLDKEFAELLKKIKIVVETPGLVDPKFVRPLIKDIYKAYSLLDDSFHVGLYGFDDSKD